MRRARRISPSATLTANPLHAGSGIPNFIPPLRKGRPCRRRGADPSPVRSGLQPFGGSAELAAFRALPLR